MDPGSPTRQPDIQFRASTTKTKTQRGLVWWLWYLVVSTTSHFYLATYIGGKRHGIAPAQVGAKHQSVIQSASTVGINWHQMEKVEFREDLRRESMRRFWSSQANAFAIYLRYKYDTYITEPILPSYISNPFLSPYFPHKSECLHGKALGASPGSSNTGTGQHQLNATAGAMMWDKDVSFFSILHEAEQPMKKKWAEFARDEE
ncbi:hypothetical protein PG997_011771 [Apiospora hydei]|uniref:Uncharacterized protein n=1 Tax=Apiospora hydei TaxID=1337664 RepID=A0ABR1V1F8_9PEZI